MQQKSKRDSYHSFWNSSFQLNCGSLATNTLVTDLVLSLILSALS